MAALAVNVASENATARATARTLRDLSKLVVNNSIIPAQKRNRFF
jgi:hypothetical protein